MYCLLHQKGEKIDINFMRCIILTIFLLAFKVTLFSQLPLKEYEDSTAKAYKLFQKKKYAEAVSIYSKTFILNAGMGKVIDRYRTASCWALLNNSDSAFFHLDKIAGKGKFGEFELISADYNFLGLQKDPRWEIIMEKIKLNKKNEKGL
ncbi:MAG: hypothetical protein EPO58_09295 [Chitinophagaceae bacterium]|nr:MAG: hypothetical protein EPO58_09295 [Chitinophagaceae bacterium]